MLLPPFCLYPPACRVRVSFCLVRLCMSLVSIVCVWSLCSESRLCFVSRCVTLSCNRARVRVRVRFPFPFRLLLPCSDARMRNTLHTAHPSRRQSQSRNVGGKETWHVPDETRGRKCNERQKGHGKGRRAFLSFLLLFATRQSVVFGNQMMHRYDDATMRRCDDAPSPPLLVFPPLSHQAPPQHAVSFCTPTIRHVVSAIRCRTEVRRYGLLGFSSTARSAQLSFG